ncbi:MAG: efflux RND transporter periplasmic adaptor subunit [Tannerellaceae bacterium]|nr:efflux RND transporter periplasmic adaptor subunit [Tannerellaceae bacterium]
MKTKKLRQVGCGLLTVILLISCKNNTPDITGVNEYPLMTISLSDKEQSSSYPATIEGRQDIEIRPQISGLITEVCVQEGQTVKKGQPLFIIDQVAYKAELEMAEANVEIAEANVETARLNAESKQELYIQNVISAFDLKTAQNALRSAEASLAQTKAQEISARNNFSFTVIKSPSDGVVGMLPYRVGTLVNSGISTPLTTVSDNSEMYVYFSMTEKQVLSLTRENGSMNKTVATMPKVQLQLGDGSIYAENGYVETISGVIDRNTGSVSVRAVFPNKERILLSGGAGKILFPGTITDCIVIPQSATFELQDKKFVYKVVEGKTQSTEIKVLPANDGKTYVVESGLEVGDIIIAEGAAFLRNGIPVNS